MARRRAYIESGRVYAVCFRVRKGLPFVAWLLIALLIKSAIARAQRDTKVIICSFIWMGNHPHFLIVAKDALQAACFCKEVKTGLTKTFKKLWGFKQLNLWESGGSVRIPLLDIEATKKRIAYDFNNPAKANLVDRIEQYPGVNSFAAFQAARTLAYSYTERIPWVRERMVPRLTSARLTRADDEALTRNAQQAARKTVHELVVQPNAWMHAFGIETDAEAAQINDDIMIMIREGEETHRATRVRLKQPLMGAERLRDEQITWDHEPKSNDRKVFVIATCPKERKIYIEAHNDLCRRCRELYQRTRSGEKDLRWPPGTFRPPLPPLANALGPPH